MPNLLGDTLPSDVVGDATFSQCQKYRYTLTRKWDESLPSVAFCGLNPSTADAYANDATMRRCIDFSMRFGFGKFIMLNLFAYRSTDPKNMFSFKNSGGDIVGADNDYWIKKTAMGVNEIILAWGNTDSGDRANDVLSILREVKPELYCLGLNKDRSPKHPLYLPKEVERKLY